MFYMRFKKKIIEKMSESLRSLTKNEGMNESLIFLRESLIFWTNRSFAHFWAKNEQFARKTRWANSQPWTKAGHIPFPPLQTWHSDYFWDILGFWWEEKDDKKRKKIRQTKLKNTRWSSMVIEVMDKKEKGGKRGGGKIQSRERKEERKEWREEGSEWSRELRGRERDKE